MSDYKLFSSLNDLGDAFNDVVVCFEKLESVRKKIRNICDDPKRKFTNKLANKMHKRLVKAHSELDTVLDGLCESLADVDEKVK